LMKRCFKDKMESEEWKTKLKQMIPSYGHTLSDDAQLCKNIRAQTTHALNLQITE